MIHWPLVIMTAYVLMCIDVTCRKMRQQIQEELNREQSSLNQGKNEKIIKLVQDLGRQYDATENEMRFTKFCSCVILRYSLSYFC